MATMGRATPEVAREIAQVQGQVVMARQFPRDTMASFNAIMEACKRPSLAEGSLYAYTRGSSTVTGPSIRLAECIAQNWGNLDFGWREVSRDKKNRALVETWCWDLQTNTRTALRFHVEATRHTKASSYALEDPRDIYENMANNAARRLRRCILNIIPGDVIDEAVATCRRTLEDGNGVPLIDRVRFMVEAFAEIGVSKDMIAGRLGYPVANCTPTDVASLKAIHGTLKDNPSKRGDFFDVPGASARQAPMEGNAKPSQRFGKPPAPVVEGETAPAKADPAKELAKRIEWAGRDAVIEKVSAQSPEFASAWKACVKLTGIEPEKSIRFIGGMAPVLESGKEFPASRSDACRTAFRELNATLDAEAVQALAEWLVATSLRHAGCELDYENNDGESIVESAALLVDTDGDVSAAAAVRGLAA